MAKQPSRRIMRNFRLDEISMVDVPAQEPAKMTLLKRHNRVTKSIGGVKFFAKDFAYVEDASDPSTWLYRLTDKPNGKPTPARVTSAIKNFGAQRYAIPPDALESILDKLREAWMAAFPSKDPNAMPPAINENTDTGDMQNMNADDPKANTQTPASEGGDTEGEEEDTAAGEDDKASVDEDGNAVEEDDDTEDDVAGAASEDDPEDESNDKKNPFPPKKKKPTVKGAKKNVVKSLVDRICKGYIDASEGAKTFVEVLEANEDQQKYYELMEEVWPLLGAMETSVRSILADEKVEATAKHSMLRNTVESFLAAIKEIMPDVEEVLEKALNGENKGDDSMNKKVDGAADLATLQKQLEDLSKKVSVLETEKNEAVTKAKSLELIAALNADEKDYYDKANDEQKAKFLGLSKADRAKAIKKALAEDESVELDGQIFSKASTDPAVFAFIKSQVAKTAALEKKLEEERAQRIDAELAKRAKDELANLSGSDEEKIAVLKALEALPEDQRKAMQSVIKTANSAASLAMSRLGLNGANLGNSDVKKSGLHPFEKSVNEIRKRDNCSRTEAVRKARQENPDEFADWNSTEVTTAH